MTTTTDLLLSQALQLPEADRARIAERLLSTLSPDARELSEAELEAELDRRLEEYERDPTTAVPWSVLKQEGRDRV